VVVKCDLVNRRWFWVGLHYVQKGRFIVLTMLSLAVGFFGIIFVGFVVTWIYDGLVAPHLPEGWR